MGGEAQAAALLRRKGFRIVAQNFRTRYGELDIVAEKDGFLVFAEVKTRKKRPVCGCAGGGVSRIVPVEGNTIPGIRPSRASARRRRNASAKASGS